MGRKTLPHTSTGRRGSHAFFAAKKSKGRNTLAFDEAGDAVTIEIDGNAAAIESDSMGFIIKFCPECGRPLTPEAWEILEKRLRGCNE